MQHSLWLIEDVNVNFDSSTAKSNDIVPPGVLLKQSSLRRIWQGKGAPSAASKVLVDFLCASSLPLYYGFLLLIKN